MVERVTIERIAYGGDGVAHEASGRVVFVPRTAAGDTCDIQIVAEAARHARARLLRLHTPGPGRTAPPCAFYERCGGCQFQHLDVETQRALKAEQLKDTMARIGGAQPAHWGGMHAGQPLHYRNKIRLHWDSAARTLGLRAHEGDDIVSIDACAIASPEVAAALARAATATTALAADPAVAEALLALEVRATAAGEQVVLAARPTLPANAPRQWAQSLSGEGRSLWWRAQARPERPTDRDRLVHLDGPQALEETVGPLRLQVGPDSFLQVNTPAAERLYARVEALCALAGHERVLDLYSGVGAISLWLAQHAEQVLAIESVEQAAELARANAARNAIENVETIADRAERALRSLRFSRPRPFQTDVVVVDPPRSGLSAPVRRALARLQTPRIVYVSCNPSTLARDVKYLASAGGFRLEHLEAHDMFPQTFHIEAIALLLR